MLLEHLIKEGLLENDEAELLKSELRSAGVRDGDAIMDLIRMIPFPEI